MARKTYDEEYRAQLVALFESRRTAESLARDFEPTAQTIRGWARAAQSAGSTKDSDVAARVKEFERENARLREERDMLKKAAAWFAAESVSTLKKGSRS